MLSGLKKKRKKPTLSRGGRAPARGSSLARPPFSFRPHYSPARQAGFSTEGRVSQEGWARAPLSATQCPVGGLLFLIGCFWDNGHLYRADQPSPAPGHSCLNWLDAQSGLAFAPESGECPSRTAGGRAEAVFQPRPMVPSLPSQAPATTATAGTRTRTHAGPGATSAARLELPRSDLARTCAAQVPRPRAQGFPGAVATPAAHVRPRDTGRPRPAPPRPIGQGCLQAAGPEAHWPAPPPGMSSFSASS